LFINITNANTKFKFKTEDKDEEDNKEDQNKKICKNPTTEEKVDYQAIMNNLERKEQIYQKLKQNPNLLKQRRT
jgi:hypothetical protein